MMVVGVILAGGKSLRMGGGDKFLRKIGGKSMLDRTLARLAPQVDQVTLSANGNGQSLVGRDLPIVEDGHYAGSGPLAGILAALRWSEATFGGDTVVVSVPADTPFIPLDLAACLCRALSASGEVAVASSLGRSHYAVAAWPVVLSNVLAGWLQRGETFALKDFIRTRRTATVAFGRAHLDPFFNINTPSDLDEAEANCKNSSRLP